MFSNLPNNLINKILPHIKNIDEENKYTLIYYIIMSSMINFSNVNLTGVSFTTLFKNKLRDQIKKKLNILLGIVIGNFPKKNQDFDNAIFSDVKWSYVTEGNHYQIPFEKYIDRLLENALEKIIK